jgi:hypothetical protein
MISPAHGTKRKQTAKFPCPMKQKGKTARNRHHPLAQRVLDEVVLLPPARAAHVGEQLLLHAPEPVLAPAATQVGRRLRGREGQAGRVEWGWLRSLGGGRGEEGIKGKRGQGRVLRAAPVAAGCVPQQGAAMCALLSTTDSSNSGFQGFRVSVSQPLSTSLNPDALKTLNPPHGRSRAPAGRPPPRWLPAGARARS